MKHIKKNLSFFKIAVLLLALFLASPSVAQISEGGIPPSFKANGISLKSMKKSEQLASPNVEQLFEEDAKNQESGAITPARIGVILPVHYTMENSGEWTTLGTGEKIWRLNIKAPNAIALSLTYDKFYLPKGAKLFIYSANKRHVLGAYTDIVNPKNGPEFATEMVAGDELVLEYVAPPSNQDAIISISGVGYVYNNTFVSHSADFNVIPAAPGDQGKSGACMVNINCSEGNNWQMEKTGVVAMVQIIGGSQYICSGSMINNTLMDLTPYFLTACHCSLVGSVEATAAELNQWQFYFHWERTGCDNTSSLAAYKSLIGAQRLAVSPLNGGSDGLLLKLNTPPPTDWGIFYNGWDRRNIIPESGVGIHHPKGDVKKISTFNGGVYHYTSNVTGGEVGAPNAHWGLSFIETAHGHGVTEGGSSGSPLFNQDHRIIGSLTGGNSACTYTDGRNAYGKLWYHWNQSANEAQWMQPYLDPTNSGTEYIDGTYFAGIKAFFKVDRTVIYASESLNFTNMSNCDTTWLWTFPGGTPSSYTGKTPPTINYNIPGTYSAKLIINQGRQSKDEWEVANIVINQKRTICETPVSIGAGTSTSQFPLGITNRQTVSSSIYTKTEIGEAGTITKLAWNAAKSTALSRYLTVYLKEVDSNEQTADTWDNEIAGATQVFSSGTSTSVYNWVNDTGWNEITLSTPFAYSGTKNLKVIVRQIGAATSPYQSSDCYYTVTPNAHKSWLPLSTGVPVGNGTIDDKRPNIRITAEAACGTPAAPVANFTAAPQIILLKEGFDSTMPPTAWELSKPGASANQWELRNVSNMDFQKIDASSKYSAFVTFDATNNVDTWIKSPAVTIADAATTLEFYTLYNGASLSGGQMNLYLSEDDGATWGAAKWTTGNVNDPAVGYKWRKQTINLSAYNGKTIKLAWQCTGQGTHYMALDGIKVSSPNTSGKMVIYEGESVTFTDLSSGPPVLWEWTIQTPASPITSALQNPAAITYMTEGTYSVTLKVTNNFGTDTKTITNAVIVKAKTPNPIFLSRSGNSFNMFANYGQFLPLSGGTVTFEDLSANYPKSWEWSLPGATPASSTEQNISATYPAGQNAYAVTLKTANNGGASSVTIPGYIQVNGTAEVWNIQKNEPSVIYREPYGHALTGVDVYEKVAERFTAISPGEVSNVKIYVHDLKAGAASMTVAIYSDKDGLPDVALSPTLSLAGNSIKNNDYNTFTFPIPVAVPEVFHVVVGSTNNTVTYFAIPAASRTGTNATMSCFYENAWSSFSHDAQLYTSLNIVAEYTYTEAALTSSDSCKRKDIDATEGTITFTTTGHSWRASAPSWIQLSAATGTINAGNGSLTFTCENNSDAYTRKGDISVYVAGNLFTINVMQGGSYPENFKAQYDNENKNVLLTWGSPVPASGGMSQTASNAHKTTNNSSEEMLSTNKINFADITLSDMADVESSATEARVAKSAAPNEVILRWDNGVHSNQIGSSAGGTFEVAILFTTGDLTQYKGTKIKAIEFYVYNIGSDMTLNIRQGGSVVYTQPLSGLTSHSFNRITLPQEIQLDATKDLMVSYSGTQAAGNENYIFGVDSGPAVKGKGDLISTDGGATFQALSSISSVDRNWNLAVILTTSSGIPPKYKIFRDGIKIAEDLTDEIYRDETATIGTTYCYSITAVYENDAFFESVQAPEKCVFIKSPISVTADDKSKTENQINPPLTGVISGVLLDSDTQEMIADMVNYECAAKLNSPAGTYAINPVINNTLSEKYVIDPIAGVLTVNTYPTLITQQPVSAKICQGDYHIFAVAATGLELTYQWQKKDGNTWQNISGANAPSYIINIASPADAGVYRLITRGRSAVTYSEEITLTVGLPEKTIVVFEWDNIPTINCNPATNGGYVFVAFQWYKNGTAIPGATKPYISLDNNGAYDCEMVTNDGKRLSLCNYTFQALRNAVAVYPNPANKDTQITVKMKGAKYGTVVNIYNTQGGLVKANLPVHGIETGIDVSGLMQGLYVLQVVSPDGTKQTVNFVIK